ncbi:MAG: hypothetical protein Q7R78_00835, partial [bacterium]|nr:hypothetical protein [bacterium]
ISELTNGFKDLTPINLKTNKISIDVNFVDYKKFSGDETMIESANFIAFVYQNDKKIADLPIKGCNLEQPFTFAGYAIPGFNKKMILLLSTKGDCWEGGYINETLNIVANLDSLNRVGYYNSYKGTSALALNEGTVTVIESDKVDIKNDTNDTVITDDIPNTPISKSPQNNFSILTIIIAVIMALVVGIFFGNYSSKK